MNKTKLIGQAQKFITKGQWDKAIKELQKLVDEDPTDVRTLLKLGDVYSKKGDKDNATRAYRQVAESYSEQGFFLKAVAVFKQILKHDSKNLEVALKLAELYQHLGLASDAMAQFQMAATIHDELGATKESLEVFKKIVELDGDNVASRIKLAESYSREGMKQEAVAEFDRACALLDKQNRHQDYIKVAERLVFHDPTRIDIVKRLAQMYASRSDSKRALAKLQACFKADPKDEETLVLLAEAFGNLGQTQKVLFVYRELARVYRERGKIEELRRALEKILELDPNDAEALAEIDRALPSATQPRAPGNGTQWAQTIESTPPAFTFEAPAPHAAASPLAAPLPTPRPMASSPAQGLLAPRMASAPRPANPRSSADRRDSVSLSMIAGTIFSPDAEKAATPPPAPPPTFHGLEAGQDEMLVLDMNDSSESPAAPPSAPRPTASPLATNIAKILTEADVFIKYRLHEKALEHVKKVFEIDASNLAALAQMRAIYLELGDLARAAETVATALRVHIERNDHAAIAAARADLAQLAPGHPAIAAVPSSTARLASVSARTPASDVVSIDIESDELVLDEVVHEAGSASLARDFDLDLEVGDESEERVEFGTEHGELDIDPFAPPPSDDGARETPWDGIAALPEDIAPRDEDLPARAIDEASLSDALERSIEEFQREHPPEILDDVEESEVNATQHAFRQDIEDELDEAEFLVEANLIDEAAQAVREILRRAPGYPRGVTLLERLGAAPEATAPAPSMSREIRAATTAPRPSSPFADAPDISSQDLFSALGVGIGGADSGEDRYDQGMALKEIGRLDAAIEEFKEAARANQRTVDALEMIGHCFLEKQDPKSAIGYFTAALEGGGHGPASTNLKFEIAKAYETCGDIANAVEWYRACRADDPSHRGVSERLTRLGA